ncbi:MAG: serine hydrolase, partial [Acidobacteria bacterium]|nr:serine hydrolase [Acidobacteriota bacterium]
MKRITFFFLAVFLLALSVSAQQTAPPKELLLFQKLDATVQSESRNFDGVLGVYLLDLAANHEISVNADETFPTASIIKIAILAE